jgi:hypothetical protein
MNNITKLAFAVALITGACAPAAAAELPAGSRQHDIVGDWTLVSIYEEDAGGEDLERWSDNPRGHFTADADGRFTLQIAGSNAIRLADTTGGHSASPAWLEYKGTYIFDPAQATISFKLDQPPAPEWEKIRPAAEIKREGDRLHFTSSLGESPTGAFYVHIVWARTN